jgi:hypothetical protein
MVVFSIVTVLSYCIARLYLTMASNTPNDGLNAQLPQKGENFETRQTGTNKNSWIPDPSKSIKLEGPRQSLLDDIIDLYSGKPSIEMLKRYTSDSVYDDPFSYANDRYQIAAQWVALPKIFDCKHNGHEVVRNDSEVIQFKNSMVRSSATDIKFDSDLF